MPTRAIRRFVTHTAIVAAAALALNASMLAPRVSAQTAPTFTVLHSFSAGYPGSLILGSDGNFYGVTQNGGSNNRGLVYKMGPGGGIAPLYSFTSADDGVHPYPALAEGSDGNFYGITQYSGANSTGTIFEVTPAGILTTLHTFGKYGSGGVDGDGIYPNGLIFGSDGNFYGTANRGGTNGNGTVFKITSAGVFTTLHSVNGANGEGNAPSAALVEGSDGNFYGTTNQGGVTGGYGTVFKITPGGTLTTLHTFSNGDDGGRPFCALVQGNDGNFYGTTSQGGGQANGGTAFKITPSGTFTTLHTFGTNAAAEGAQPYFGVIQGTDGNFYGTTYRGLADSNGSYSPGSIFEMTPAGVVTTLYNFGAGYIDGNFPNALVEGTNGKLYGTAEDEGPNGAGTTFRLDVNLFTLQFTASSYQAAEAAPTVTLTVTRAPGSPGAATLQYATADGTATAGRDYTAASGTLSWASGDTTPRSITVNLLNPGETYPNAKRRFTVALSNATGSGIIGATSTATVVLFGTTEKPVITSATSASGAVAAAFSYQITATDGPSSYGVLGLPKGLSVNATTGLISGMPAAAGTYALTLKANNQGGQGTAGLTLTVTLQKPVITSADTATAGLDEAFSYQITASGNPTHFGVLGLPKELTVNGQTGLISGTLTSLATYTLTLQASNAIGTGTQKLVLTVRKEAPVITSATTATATQHQPFSYQITASGNPTQFRVLGLVNNLTVNSATGLISGTPTVGGVHTLTLEAVNAQGTGKQTLTLTINKG